MDSLTVLRASRVESPNELDAATSVERTVTAIAAYQLSENGRKALLLAGGDGRAMQQVAVHVPATRLHLVTVDADGTARLKIRPRYQLDALQRVVRVDAPPTYDAPPTTEDLLTAAARNHQLERTYYAERTAAQTTRRETRRELQRRLAEQFLADKSQRAVGHPVPTPKSCYLPTPHGQVRFDTTKDEGLALQVPPEAHRRFRADLRARVEDKRQAHAAQLAIHEGKKRAVAEWVATHGTPDQQARHAAGMLSIEETLEGMTDQAYQYLRRFPLYARDGAERLQAYLRQSPVYAKAIVTPLDLAITVCDAPDASAVQWERMQEIKAVLPAATITLRAHRLAWKGHTEAPTLTVFGVRVKLTVGPFTLCREYAAPDA
jgi:hypothetical protein